MQKLRQDFLPADFAPLLSTTEVAGTIAVQADQSYQETEFLLSLAEKNTFIKGVVGWVDLKGEQLHQHLERYRDRKLLKGFRHIIQSEKPGFLTDPVFIKGVNILADF